ncbi:hypothetical protein BC831DRAFT_116638 [Entophlyctis helioformis]|nr:hypothetical protein BC831DRAFT_116638 [Entophlyctis helioformis]
MHRRMDGIGRASSRRVSRAVCAALVSLVSLRFVSRLQIRSRHTCSRHPALRHRGPATSPRKPFVEQQRKKSLRHEHRPPPSRRHLDTAPSLPTHIDRSSNNMAQVSLPHHHSSSMHADKDRSVVGNFMACLDIQSNAAHASVPRFAIPSAMETDMPENNSHMSMSPPASASDVCCHGITRSCSLCSVCSASSSISAASLGSPAPAGHYNIACALDPSPLGKAVPTHDHSHFQSHSIQQQQQQYLVHQPRPVHLASGNQHPSSACTSITPLTRAPSYHGSVSSAAVRPACNLLRPPAAPKPALAFPQHSQPLSSQVCMRVFVPNAAACMESLLHICSSLRCPCVAVSLCRTWLVAVG